MSLFGNTPAVAQATTTTNVPLTEAEMAIAHTLATHLFDNVGLATLTTWKQIDLELTMAFKADMKQRPDGPWDFFSKQSYKSIIAQGVTQAVANKINRLAFSLAFSVSLTRAEVA